MHRGATIFLIRIDVVDTSGLSESMDHIDIDKSGLHL